ncbi:hypothetical protein [Streptomyces nigrescens]|uniref:hypothetical protein n=1 Tax=Streptomyces nigrescens TaxID=1920 RepID=UPI00349400FF
MARRTGDFELAVYKAEDPDAAQTVLQLNTEEADTVAEILGAPRIAERFADLRCRDCCPGRSRYEPAARVLRRALG